ncbi:MAG: enoyl-CoA hydratase/isomerase family protein, partial [Spirochaetes bacterium]|nr:enoyl-CoA hydratase/isomerase family protein [Spirochaetota bacterium]
MSFNTIEYREEGHIGILTLNRPDKLNAVNIEMRDELRVFFKDRLNEFNTKVIILTGSGRGFCSGLDMKEFAKIAPGGGFSPQQAYEFQKHSDLVLFMRRVPQPIIGVINGVALGAGFSLALACDVRIASTDAKFSAAYINIGLGGADMGSSWLFPRAVGSANASRYLLTGDMFDAEEARRIGMVQSVVRADKLMEEAMKLANTMASKSPFGLQITKDAINCNIGGTTLEDALRIEDRN